LEKGAGMATKNPGLYADIGKKSSDLLNKEFPLQNRIEVKTRTANGVELEVNATRSQDGSICGVLNPKYKFKAHGVGLSATVDTNRVVKLEGSVDDLLPGLKTTVTGHSDTESLTFDVEYKHEYFTASTSCHTLDPSGTTLTSSAVVGLDGWGLGGQATYSSAGQRWTQINGVASYTSADFVATLFTRTKPTQNLVGGSYFQRISDRVAVGGEMTVDLNKEKESTKLTVGGSYDLDPLTTVKGKFDTDGKLSLSYAQRLNKYARLIIGSTINTNNLSPSGNHQFGFTLSLND
jgi:voltage-dependent anion channel protein 2